MEKVDNKIIELVGVTKEFDDELKKINSLVYGRSSHVEKYAWKLENIKKYKNTHGK